MLDVQHGHAGKGTHEPAAAGTIAVKVISAANDNTGRSVRPVTKPATVPKAAPFADPSPAAQPDEPEPLFPVVLPAAPTYHVPAELDAPPRVVQDVPLEMGFNVPDLPPQMLVLRLLINELGEVDKVLIEDSSLPAAAESSIIQSFLRMRFEPGRMENIPVKSQIRIEVTLDFPTDSNLSGHS